MTTGRPWVLGMGEAVPFTHTTGVLAIALMAAGLGQM
jgi:hypothetical protein